MSTLPNHPRHCEEARRADAAIQKQQSGRKPAFLMSGLLLLKLAMTALLPAVARFIIGIFRFNPFALRAVDMMLALPEGC